MLALKLYASVWRPTFEVTLKPIPLQKIDILAAQLRDLKEEIVQLQSEKDESAQLTLETTQTVIGVTNLLWMSSNAQCDTPDKFEIEADGKIRFRQAGCYLISLSILHQSSQNYTCTCEIQRDGVCVKSFSSLTCQYAHTPSFTFVASVLMKEGQELVVVNKTQNYVRAQSTMLIALLK